MENDIIGQILSVLGRPTNNGKTIYDIAFSDGNTYTTFDGKVAGKAQALQGQQVSARVKVQQKGQYTNLYLNDVAPVGQLPPQQQPVAAGSPVAQIPLAPATSPPSRGGMSPEREAKIVKQSVLSTAFGFVGALYTGAGPEAAEEATAKALELAKTLYANVLGGGPVATPQAVAETPQEVAAEVNSELAGAVVVGAQEGPVPAWL